MKKKSQSDIKFGKNPTLTLQKKNQSREKRGRFPLWAIAGAVLAVGALAVFIALPKKGEIEIKSNPPGAKIYLDNADTGKTTNFTLTDLKPGDYSVKLLKDGYGDYTKQSP